MPEIPELTPELRAGRRSLLTVPECELVHDFEWEESLKLWRLHIRLHSVAGEFVPAHTEWHVTVAPAYPWGSIDVYPDATHGIQATFYHQGYNEAVQGRPWRSGKICVATALHGFTRRGYDVEPYEAEERLRWYVLRALEWVHAAATDDLVREGEPFELPAFEPPGGTTVAFNEDASSFGVWSDISHRSGLVELKALPFNPRVQITSEFQTVTGRSLVTSEWGAFAEHPESVKAFGVWLRLDDIPVLRPWKAPMTWGELRQVCEMQGIDLDALLRPALAALQEVAQAEYGFVGFPIPAEFGATPATLHWQAFRIPKLRKRFAKGFRNNEHGHWIYNLTNHFTTNTGIQWLPSENWHADQLSTRGRLPRELRDCSVAVLGAGSLGSAVAEQLVRAGVHRMVIVDPETLQAGNLVRHTLLLDSVLGSKAMHLAARLSGASPNARVKGIESKFPAFTDEQKQLIAECDLVLDLTGSDEVLREGESYPWRAGQTFISGSLGMGSKRLFCYVCDAMTFSHADFQQRIEPWLTTEVVENRGCQLPREGIGCWHPVFPARVDDVWMMASVLVKCIAVSASAGPASASLAVFEQEERDGAFYGILRISEELAVA